MGENDGWPVPRLSGVGGRVGVDWGADRDYNHWSYSTSNRSPKRCLFSPANRTASLIFPKERGPNGASVRSRQNRAPNQKARHQRLSRARPTRRQSTKNVPWPSLLPPPPLFSRRYLLSGRYYRLDGYECGRECQMKRRNRRQPHNLACLARRQDRRSEFSL